MLKRLFTFLFLAACFSAGAQVTDTALVAVRYSFRYVTDTTHPDEVSTENMVLLIGKNASVFKSYDKYLRDSVLREQLEKQVFTPGGSMSIVSPPGMKVGSPTAFYKFPAMGTLNQLELMMKYYSIEETMPVIDWKVLEETKNIHELPCQKATGVFRGRTYTAWFCSQLPYNNGPWKLGGLPGLIMEAEDDKKEVVFSFDSFENVAGRKMAIVLPGNAITTNREDFKKLRDAIANNPGAANSSEGDMNFKVTRVSGPSVPVKKKVNNNPIEKTK